MGKHTNKISVLIPIYNEAQSIDILYKKLLEVLQSYDHEIVFVNDGSRDNSQQILNNIKNNDNRVIVIELKRNFGKAAVLAVGFEEVSGDLVITMDGDLQDEPQEIPKMIEEIDKGYDLVSGWKKDRQDPLIKKISSKIFNFTVRVLTGIKLHDFNCGFKIYKKEVVKSLDVYGDLHRFLPVLAYQQGFKVGEIKVRHNERKFGQSKYGRSGLKRLGNYILDPINVVLITKYQYKPAHFFGSWGLILFFVGLIINIYLSVLWFLGQGPIGNRPLLFLGVLLMIIGIQLVSMGFLGELIIRGHFKKDKNYYIKSKK